jgi:hypothetical protein
VRDNDLATYLGSTHSALGFMLFAFGCAAFLAFGVVALQIGLTDEENDLGIIVWLIPVWGLMAVPLGLSMRRKEPSAPALLLGCSLLAIPAGLALVSRF